MLKIFSLVNSRTKSSVVNLRNALLLFGCLLFLAPPESQAQIMTEIDVIIMRNGMRSQPDTRSKVLEAPKRHANSISALAITNETQVGNVSHRQVRQETSPFLVSSFPWGNYDLTSFYYMMRQWIGYRP